MATRRLLNGAKTILVILILLLSCHPKIFACSCNEKLTIEEAVKDAELVIDARALRKSNYNATTNRFYINHSFKGGFQRKDSLSIFSTNSSSSCGFSFEEEGRYIIYAYSIFDKDHNRLIIGYETNVCTRTTRYNYEEINAIKLAVANYPQQSEKPNIDLKQKVFEIGSKIHFTDSCSFYFECDCCSGKIVFNSDSTFYYLGSCAADLTARKGYYTWKNDTLQLTYMSLSVSRLYNFENETDTSATDFIISDTNVEETVINYSVSLCDNRILLSDLENDKFGIETTSSYNEVIEFISNHFSERFNQLQKKD